MHNAHGANAENMQWVQGNNNVGSRAFNWMYARVIVEELEVRQSKN